MIFFVRKINIVEICKNACTEQDLYNIRNKKFVVSDEIKL
jgi:hypothetical protein